MNKHQKLVQQQFLNDEEKVIGRLKSVYKQSLKDITSKVSVLDSSITQLKMIHDSVGDDELGDLAAAFFKGKAQHMTPEEAKETLQSMIQSKVYQKNYQTALKKQVDGIYDKMLDKEFSTVSDYLTECYENGFVGTLFDLHGQGIPMAFPLDQEAMVRAVQLDSKISQGLYARLGEDVDLLKKKITAQVSRGISTGMTFQQVAQQLAGTTNIGFNNAVRIARTEGHRIQCQSGMDACYKAKEKGADVVKQWDATLDSSTRESHVAVDGEIRELDKPFSNGLMFPGDPAGGAAEVINCRCALLQRARWALDEDELQALKEKAEFFGLDKTDSFENYKKNYLKASEEVKAAEMADHPAVNKYGHTIVFADNMNSDKWSESKTIIKDLADEYDTRLTTVGTGARGGAGDVDMGGAMRLSSTENYVAIHEFAHSMATEALTKYGVVDDSAFWKEIKGIKRAYKKDVGDNSSRWISSYEHSSKLIDEFFAEAFTQAKMHQMGLPLPNRYGNDLTYSNQVLQITDKYFKKPLTNSSKDAKINLQFFASKEKQFGKKVGKHAADFGLDPSKAEDREKFQNIINNIIAKAENVRIGSWRGQTEEVLFYVQGKDVVITNQQNEFITILKGGIDNARVKNARNK